MDVAAATTAGGATGTTGMGVATSFVAGTEEGAFVTGVFVLGAFVADALVAAGLGEALLLISPGEGIVEFVSVPAAVSPATEMERQMTVKMNRRTLPPYKNVKKVISQLMRI